MWPERTLGGMCAIVGGSHGRLRGASPSQRGFAAAVGHAIGDRRGRRHNVVVGGERLLVRVAAVVSAVGVKLTGGELSSFR
jgi:hypothetical protein